MDRTGIITTYEIGVDLVVEWKIENFFNLPQWDGVGYFSPEFSFGGERWFLVIYPNGSSRDDSSGHVDLSLCKYDSDRSIKQSFSLSLKTAKGEKYNEQHGTKDFDNDYWEYGFYRFLARSKLSRRRSDLVPEGTLTIICTMKSSTSAGSDSNTASTSEKCSHCKITFHAQSLSSHQKRCMYRPIKCPDCLEIVVLQKWLDEHEYQMEILQGTVLEENSENICVEACTQTEEENEEKSENISVEASTQTGEENAEIFKNICMEASTQTGEENGDEWFKEKSRNACVEASTQTEEQSEDLKQLSTAELNKADTPEVFGSDEAEASGSNQTGATKSKKLLSPVNVPEERDWVTNISDFLKDGRGVDVTFELETPSGKTEFIAHQLILALRSPYFADEFYGEERNNGHLRISLKGIDPKAFEQMIRYCYDYKPCLKITKDACALFKVAFEFKVLNLQKLCHTFIRDSKIEAENVFSVLEVSEQMEDKSLGDMCNKLLQDKTRDVMATYELCDVTPVMVHTFLNLSNLSLNSEYELIKWIFEWAKVKCQIEDSTSQNAREYLERWLKDMNFLALTMEEFAVLHKDNPEFFSSDEIASICLNITCPGTRQMPAWYDNNVKCRVYAGSKE